MSRRQVRLIFILSVNIFLIAGIIVITNTAKILKEDDQLFYASEIHEDLHEFRINFGSALQNHGNFFLTGKNTFYNEYGKNKHLAHSLYKNIQRAQYGSFFHEELVDSMGIYLSRLFNNLDKSILNSEVESPDIDNNMVFSVAIINYHKLETLAGELSAKLEGRIQEIRVKNEKKAFTIITIIVSGNVIGLMLLITSFFYLNKEFKKTRSKEKEVREKANELSYLNSTKDTFFSIIAHDLKGPFNSLINLFALMNTAIKEKDLSLIEENVYSIEFSARRTYNLLQNLLEWARLQTGTIRRNPEFFDIFPIIDENMQLFREGARQKGIGLSTSIKSQMIFADKNMINTVVRNLIQNALKFTEKGSINISISKLPEFVNIIIEDTGIGIAKEDIDKLFRIDHDPKMIGESTEKGSGLGLILCKNFIEQNKGRIWVESELNKGTRFFFSLPYKK